LANLFLQKGFHIPKPTDQLRSFDHQTPIYKHFILVAKARTMRHSVFLYDFSVACCGKSAPSPIKGVILPSKDPWMIPMPPPSLSMPRLALYQPEIPQNTGSLMRLCACLGLGLDIIEPTGFVLDDRRLRRAAMDYLAHLDWQRHKNWESFFAWTKNTQRRVILLTTKASLAYVEFSFTPHDILLLGQESAGVPQEVHDAAWARISIPMRENLRSLNVAMAGAMIVGEAMRQLSLPSSRL
jgi:tRNA (cytidine/uridine-2'-O-)-methyltransferase